MDKLRCVPRILGNSFIIRMIVARGGSAKPIFVWINSYPALPTKQNIYAANILMVSSWRQPDLDFAIEFFNALEYNNLRIGEIVDSFSTPKDLFKFSLMKTISSTDLENSSDLALTRISRVSLSFCRFGNSIWMNQMQNLLLGLWRKH